MTPVGHDGDRVTVAGVFVELAAAQVAPYTVSDLAQRLVDGCVEVLDVWAAGLLIADPGSTPKVLAASTHQAELLELVQVSSGQGPCLQAMAGNSVVVVEDLDDWAERWPDWVAGARAMGIRYAYGIPLHRDRRTIGALNLFRREDGPLRPEDLAVGRALADVAAVGILQHRALDQATTVTQQLQHALESRVILEQAKGVLAEREGITVVEAFVRMRQHARSTSQPLGEVARALVEDGADLDPA